MKEPHHKISSALYSFDWISNVDTYTLMLTMKVMSSVESVPNTFRFILFATTLSIIQY